LALPVEEWLAQREQHFKGVTNRELNEEKFHRDPTYATILDRTKFYAPADGTLIYQKVVQPGESVEIKGKLYSLNDLFENQEVPRVPCLCIAIFMTMWDVHVNKVPFPGILQFRMAHPILSYNIPMDFAQDDIVGKKFRSIQTHMHGFEVTNARMINRIYNPEFDYSYSVIQIADDAVNTVAHFTSEQNQWFEQCQRFSIIRFGSQVDTILPLDPRYDLQTFWPDLYHVEGGIDPIIRMIPVDQKERG
jgi:phosphatidylserine decarboxylase